jgi:pyridoxamine 5'-phosphate oxidase
MTTRTAKRSRPIAGAPLARFRRWFAQARAAEQPLAEAMALATADERGRPSVRLVLLKHADEQGFVFYTNAASRKGRELRGNPRAAAVFHWDRLGRQVRVEGRVEMVSAAEADAYWATRPRESQLAALASAQSAALGSRRELLETWRRLRCRHRGADVPRPRDWTGFRIAADAIEFWTHRDHRLHDRELFVRGRQGWKSRLLQP